ncbi:hypothetical protein DIE05_29940 [Burkholderia sp. Bp8995]|nr:hypothetical protein DIE05_29940 [Burkholderia sp. Bp8995]
MIVAISSVLLQKSGFVIAASEMLQIEMISDNPSWAMQSTSCSAFASLVSFASIASTLDMAHL